MARSSVAGSLLVGSEHGCWAGCGVTEPKPFNLLEILWLVGAVTFSVLVWFVGVSVLVFLCWLVAHTLI